MNIAEILNWPDLRSQFGLVDNANGILSAKQLSRNLKDFINEKEVTNDCVTLSCSVKGEAIAIFMLRNKFGTAKTGYTFVFEYTGTAN